MTPYQICAGLLVLALVCRNTKAGWFQKDIDVRKHKELFSVGVFARLLRRGAQLPQLVMLSLGPAHESHSQ